MHVLHKAVEDFKNGSAGKTTRARKAYQEAKRWIWSSNEDFPSFLFLCEHLELDSRGIRKELRGYELSQRRQTECGEQSVVELECCVAGDSRES
jgi:hypothetical protein